MKIEGIECSDISVADTGIQRGDLYMAKRNTGWKLLECFRYDSGIVYPKGIEYTYSDYECFRVIVM